MRHSTIHAILPALALLCLGPLSHASGVGITADLFSVEVVHKGRKMTIQRKQDTASTINPDYARTSRKCPPFCIQPQQLAEGVETIAELEMLEYLQRISQGDDTVLVIDSRTPDWVSKGTIPGSVNIPWTSLKPESGADPFTIADIFEQQFNARSSEGFWDFSQARTLVLFCNGMWCGQSPSNIRTLLRFGYPAAKLKWYRGGMQSWESVGLTVVK
ncbi:MAG: rhodanese-like domain-containing protein [Thiotrichales bacterium]|nr:rhodanese-like domain-containing protein [Thiotrichales bacterium]